MLSCLTFVEEKQANEMEFYSYLFSRLEVLSQFYRKMLRDRVFIYSSFEGYNVKNTKFTVSCTIYSIFCLYCLLEMQISLLRLIPNHTRRASSLNRNIKLECRQKIPTRFRFFTIYKMQDGCKIDTRLLTM